MKPANLYQIELAAVFANGRSLAIKLGYAYLLGLPFALLKMSVNARVIGVIVLILFTSFFGAATTIVSRRSDGLLEKLRMLPIRKRGLYIDFILSGAAVGVVFLLLLVVNGSSISLNLVLGIAGTFVLSALLLNILGMLLGTIAKGSQEVYLIGSLGVGVIGFFSGLYPVSGRIEPVIDAISRFSPLRYLADTMRWSMADSAVTVGTVTGWQALLSAILIAIVVIGFSLRTFDRGAK